MIPNALVTLLRNPEQLALVRGDRSLLPAAVEESLRCEPPLPSPSSSAAPASAIGAAIAWLLTSPDAAALQHDEVAAQAVALEHGLHPDWRTARA